MRPALALLVALAASHLSTAHAETPKRACVEASTDGQTLRKDDKLLEARDKLRVCAADPCPSVVKTHCAKWLTELEAQIPSAIVRARDTAGADVLNADVTIDGHPSALGRPETLDPGEHVITVKRGSEAAVEKKFLLVDGEKGRILTVELPVAAGRDASTIATSTPGAHGKIPIGAWVLGGAGIVALGSFAFFAAKASSDLSDLRNTCGKTGPFCTDAQTSSGRTHAAIADVSLGVGIAAVGAAVVWAIVGRSSSGEKPPASATTLDVHPTPGGAVGTVGIRF